MADTIRHQILSALIAHLELETETWGVDDPIPVNPGKTRYKPEDLPALSIFARMEESEPTQYGTQISTLNFEINYAGVITRDASDEKESIIDQIETVRGKIVKSLVDASLDDLADPPVYTGGDIEYPSAEDMAFIVSVNGRIDYEYQLTDPYTQ